MSAIQNRYDFVYLFDVSNGNPNGDPDAGNLPRMDPETSHGLVTDVALKRKVRNYVDMRGGDRNAIFIRERDPLNPKIAQACEAIGLPSYRRSASKGRDTVDSEEGSSKKKTSGKTESVWDTDKAKRRSTADIRKLQEWLCERFFDIRTFGAVMSTGPNAGQIRGPTQLSFARSVEPIMPLEIAITRLTDVDKEEGEMGRKHIVPYGLYRAHGYVSAKLAERTGFSDDDLMLFFDALGSMFEHDRSAARGEMAARCGIGFKHASAFGNARADDLFKRVQVLRVDGEDTALVGDKRIHNWPPARSFSDYLIKLDDVALPEGVEVIKLF
jgi:CRISPR-associated protein Csd2